jgi:hypothetical protein
MNRKWCHMNYEEDPRGSPVPHGNCPWDEHINRVNQEYQYCKKIEDPFEFIGKCEPTDLPSYHPYWKHAYEQSVENLKKEMQNRLDECIKTGLNLKYFFGGDATKESVQNKINTLT